MDKQQAQKVLEDQLSEYGEYLKEQSSDEIEGLPFIEEDDEGTLSVQWGQSEGMKVSSPNQVKLALENIVAGVETLDPDRALTVQTTLNAFQHGMDPESTGIPDEIPRGLKWILPEHFVEILYATGFSHFKELQPCNAEFSQIDYDKRDDWSGHYSVWVGPSEQRPSRYLIRLTHTGDGKLATEEMFYPEQDIQVWFEFLQEMKCHGIIDPDDVPELDDEEQ